MAWQYQFDLAPAAAVARRWPLIHPATRIAEEDRVGLWEGIGIPFSLIQSLNRMQPESRLINEAQIRWGSEQSTHVDVLLQGDRLHGIKVAVDVRTPHLAFLGEIAMLALRHEWLVITLDGRIFQPSARRFLTDIRLSPAKRWACGSVEALVQRKNVKHIA